MNVVLWILQAVLAAVFLGIGTLKLVKPKESLLDRVGVLEGFRPVAIKAIGLSEVLGALGLVVAPLVGWDELVPWAALGLGSVMVAAAIVHGERGEWTRALPNGALLALCLVVMYGRSAHVPL